MRFSALASIVILAQLACGVAVGQTTLYKAVCNDSSFKDADRNTDLATVPGVPITCVGVTISMLASKRVSALFVIPGQSVLGFGGDGLDEKSNAKFITLPLKRVYLPSKVKSDVPLTVDGIDGICLLDGRTVRALTGIICIAKLDSGTRRQIYEVNSRLLGAGQTIQPGSRAK